MLEGGGHPVGIETVLRRALLIAAPEYQALAAIGRAIRPRHPAPLSRRGLTPPQISHVGIAAGKDMIQDELIFRFGVNGGEMAAKALPGMCRCRGQGVPPGEIGRRDILISVTLAGRDDL